MQSQSVYKSSFKKHKLKKEIKVDFNLGKSQYFIIILENLLIMKLISKVRLQIRHFSKENNKKKLE